MLLILLILIILFGGGFGYWGHAQYGTVYPYASGSFGLGGVLLVVLVCYLLGMFR